jgi:hypothetical protein
VRSLKVGEFYTAEVIDAEAYDVFGILKKWVKACEE